MIVVVKIGTSSLTDGEGQIRSDAIDKLCGEVAQARALGHQVVVVTSAAIGAGLPALGLAAADQPTDAVTLQAISAVGQSRLMADYNRAFAPHGLVCGQVLLAPLDFFERQQYLHARGTLRRLLELGVVPVVNENDAVADDAIRFGDNDRIAALVAHLVGAELLVLLTDTEGMLTADPRLDDSASLIDEIVEVDHELEAVAGGAGRGGSGGMTAKLSAAKIASWSGITSIIAAAHRPDVVVDAIVGAPGTGTVVRPRQRTLSARRLWIAFAVRSAGVITVDDGARHALANGGSSLLAVGVTGVTGQFVPGDAVEVAAQDGTVFAKGLVATTTHALEAAMGKRSGDQPAESPDEVIHRDELVLVP